MPADLTAADVRRLLKGTTPGPWWPSHYNEPGSVDRGKVWAFRDDAPGGPIVVGEINPHVGRLEDQRLFAAAPNLGRAVIREAERADRLEVELKEARAAALSLEAQLERTTATCMRMVAALIGWEGSTDAPEVVAAAMEGPVALAKSVVAERDRLARRLPKGGAS